MKYDFPLKNTEAEIRKYGWGMQILLKLFAHWNPLHAYYLSSPLAFTKHLPDGDLSEISGFHFALNAQLFQSIL